jgi:hypothetical protein
MANKRKVYTKSTLKELIWADLTRRSPPSSLPLTDLQYFESEESDYRCQK